MRQQGAVSSKLSELAILFLRLGLTAFGGPAAHIAMMHDEAVTRRGWLSDEEFLDLIGATSLIPGPNSTEMAIHIGYRRAGLAGLLVAGACFIFPAVSMVLLLAWAYVRFGTTPAANAILYGVKPVVIAIIAGALWKLGQKAVKGVLAAVAGTAVLAGYFLGVNELLLLFGAGSAVMLLTNLQRWRGGDAAKLLLLPLSGLPACVAHLANTIPFSLGQLFLTFLKIGAVLYGSGYVLLAFLQADFVNRFGWLTEQQLVDAVAVGQVTPGPVFTTATFVGYVLGGLPGAALATIGIFIPSFFFVAISNPLIPRLRHSPWFGALLDGVNAAALGLMAAVTIQLGRAALVDGVTVALTIIAFLLQWRLRVNTVWLVAGGAIVGFLRSLL